MFNAYDELMLLITNERTTYEAMCKLAAVNDDMLFKACMDTINWAKRKAKELYTDPEIRQWIDEVDTDAMQKELFAYYKEHADAPK